jgi:hypothetical protein
MNSRRDEISQDTTFLNAHHARRPDKMLHRNGHKSPRTGFASIVTPAVGTAQQVALITASNATSATSRSMLVELQADNSDGRLLGGTYN